MTKNQEVKANAQWLLLIVFTLIGLGLSIELTYLHVKVWLEPGFKSFCALNAKVNCETVARSSYAVFLNVPVSVWGIFGYTLILFTSFLGWRSEKSSPQIHGALFLLTMFSAISSIMLAFIAFAHLGSYCLLCIATYVVNILLLFFAWAARIQEKQSAGLCTNAFLSWAGGNMGAFVAPAIIPAVLIFAYPKYWDTQIKTDSKVTSGFDHGHAWIGAKNPRITLIEFADYECPYCQETHKKVRAIVNRYKDVLRLVHRHYPLDRKCNSEIKRKFHQKACMFARAAHCGGEQKKFWPINDFLFNNSKKIEKDSIIDWASSNKYDAKKLAKCMDSNPAYKAISDDIQEGIYHKITGTPFMIFKQDGVTFHKGYLMFNVPKKKHKSMFLLPDLLKLLNQAQAGALPKKSSQTSTPAPAPHRHTPILKRREAPKKAPETRVSPAKRTTPAPRRAPEARKPAEAPKKPAAAPTKREAAPAKRTEAKTKAPAKTTKTPERRVAPPKRPQATRQPPSR